MAKKTADTTTMSAPAAGPDQKPKRPPSRNDDKTSSPKAAPPAKQPAAGKKSAATATAAPTRKRGLSQHEIGEVAGEIWHRLSDSGPETVAALKKSIDAPADLVLAAVGWLAREGKLGFESKGRSVKVSLR